jgi:phosphoribosylaminoimidazolecarboxamide formyltransferase/IMP cyclohydrolase
MNRRVLISVHDKDGVLELARVCLEAGYDIVSSGGTAAHLAAHGLPITTVEEVTGCPEFLGGRVKTLHPAIHGGILARSTDEDRRQLDRIGAGLFEIVIVNLYPFTGVPAEAAVDELVEMIDIGGAALIRAAAKNHERVTVVVDRADYAEIIAQLRIGAISPEVRRRLAVKAFQTTAAYDAAIWQRLAKRLLDEEVACRMLTGGEALRYGENPHQAASIHRRADAAYSLKDAAILAGKPMSYNNYLDLFAALRPLFDLESPAVSVVKHANACGLATHPSISQAFEFAWGGDPKSAYGGIVAMNRACPLEVAGQLKGRYIEIIAAPAFADDALAYLKRKNADLRVIAIEIPRLRDVAEEFHGIGGIDLTTVIDRPEEKEFKAVTAMPMPTSMNGLLRFGVISSAHLKSNAASLVCRTPDGSGAMQLGMGCGQPNRIDALERLAIPKALERSREIFGRDGLPEETVLVSEAFFPFSDVIETARRHGIRYIVQPGGSKRDAEVIARCDEYGIAMALTGIRHFRHF